MKTKIKFWSFLNICAILITAVIGMPKTTIAADLNVMLFGMPYTRGLAKLEADFKAKTGISAKIQVVGQNVFENRITLAFTGKTGDIDVVHTPVIQVQKWVKAGWLHPITSEINSMSSKNEILAGPLDAYLINGDRWAVPFLAAVGMMAYRPDLLAAAGFDGPPKTWEEVMKASAIIKSKGTAGIAMRVAPGQGFNMFVYPMIMRAYGGTFFANYPTDLTPAMNSPENLKALEFYSKLMNDYGPDGIGNFNFSEVSAAMKNGQVAMIVEGDSVVAQTVDPKKSKFADKISIAAVPSGPKGRSPAIAVHGLGIPAHVKNPEASFKFIEWATSKEVLTKIALAEPFQNFANKSVSENQEVIAKYKAVHPDFLKIRVEMLDQAIGHYRPLLPQWPQIGAAVGENINAAVNGVMTNKEALEASDEDIKAILSQ